MPLTFAHPGFVLPIASRFGQRVSLLGLVFGSLLPDLPYFLSFIARAEFTHSIAGVFIYCVPIGLIVTWLFVRYLQLPLVELLPDEIFMRIGKSNLLQKLPLPQIAFSILLGALTHVVLDSFTHAKASGVVLFPVLNRSIDLFNGNKIYKLLQHFGTVIGFALIAYYIARWRKSTPRAAHLIARSLPKHYIILARCGLLLTTLISTVLGVLTIPSGLSVLDYQRHILHVIVIHGTQGFLASAVLYVVWWQQKVNGAIKHRKESTH